VVGNRISLGRILGVEIRIDLSWFVVFVLVTWSLGGQYYPSMYRGWTATAYWLMGLLTALLFFASVLAHELAHSVVSQANGVPVHDITLFIFGGAAHLSDEPKTARGELIMAAVGPLTSLGLSAGFGLLWLVGRGANQYLAALSTWLGGINLSLALFNLIPGFPLDGGRIFRAIIWAFSRNLRLATRVATALGRVVALGFILLGVWQMFTGNWVNGLWIAFIGWFVENAATSSYQRFALRETLAGRTANEVMSRECAQVPRSLTLDVLVEKLMLPSGRRCFPVQEEGHLYGLVTPHRVGLVPRERWPQTRAEDVMIPRAELKTVRSTDELNVVLDRLAAEDVNQFLVVDGEQLLGIVARDSVLRFIRAHAEPGGRG